ncbi:MAG: NAD(P)/FAD-dependent oxidoreductase, partial [Chitinophagales bacterium]
MKNPIYYETVSQALSELRKRGYNVDFRIDDDKGAYFTCSNITSPLSLDEFEIDETYRFEDNTDPGDAMIVYAISSKKHAVKGVIANAYGTYADACTSLLVDKLVTHDRKNDKKKVIVIGGGFAGVQFVQKIDETVFDILLIDRINHHQFQPLFYQVATSQLEPASISFPLRNIFKKKKNLQIRLTEVLHIKPDLNLIQTTIGDFDYDILVIAIGCQTNFFGNKEISKNAFTLKTTYDAINIRNHILQLFESLISSNEEEKEYLQNLIIVGAGPTGVELAGAFSEIKNDILPKDYPGIDFSKFNITLIEGSPHTLNSMSIQAKETSRKYLEEMGVKLRMETFVKNYDGKILTLSNGEIIKSKTVIWAAGVIGNRIEGFAETHITSSNRIKVNRMNLIN